MTSKINLRIFLTARNEAGARLCFYIVSCDSVHRGNVPACIAGGIPACLAGLQATPRGEVEGSGLGGSPDPHLGGFQAHTQVDVNPGLTPGWRLYRSTPGGEGFQTQTWGGGGLSRPTPGVDIPACTETDNAPRTATAAGGTHPTGMHSSLKIGNMNYAFN